MRITRDIKDIALAEWLQAASEEELVRAFVERDIELSITEMNAKGGAFDFLADEPDLYTDADVKEKNETFIR